MRRKPSRTTRAAALGLPPRKRSRAQRAAVALGLMRRPPSLDRRAAAFAVSAALTAACAPAAVKLVHMRRVRHADGDQATRYRLNGDEPVSDGVRRIARGQIDLAWQQLEGARGSDLDEAVHQARKAFKRLRALLRLARDELGNEVYRRENEIFRDAGRKLSGTRDARVMAQTLDALVSNYREELPSGIFGGLRDALGAEAELARKRLEEDRTSIDGILATLAAARVRVATWPLREDGGIEMLAPGFERIYKRGRRARLAAKEDPTAESLHELRKRAKDLWHCAQVLRPVEPEAMRALADEAHALADVIGDDHDMAVLLDGATRRSGKLRPGELELLRALVRRRRARLSREALAGARRVYRRRPSRLSAPVARAA